jgi:predicted MPP superfamily phosphohydrolase
MRSFGRVVVPALGVLTLMLGWGIAVEPRLLYVEKVPVEVPSLPQQWEQREIAFVSDVHVGIPLANTDTTRRAVDWITAHRPAAVLLGGDFLYASGPDPAGQVDTLVDLLRPVTQAGIPTYAVFGNQDAAAAPRLYGALTDLGIRVLANEVAALPPPGGPPDALLHLVGIAPHQPVRLDDPQAALAPLPADAPRIVFMHDPSSFEFVRGRAAPVAIAGHTHGGQVRIPFTPRTWSWTSLIFSGDVLGHGWIDGYGRNGNRLYVSRGLGMSWAPIRFASPPELTVLRLHDAPPPDTADGRTSATPNA